jgi:hypothetical protein
LSILILEGILKADMATLTDASVIARKGVRYGLYLIVALVIGRFLLNAGIAAYKNAFPTPPPKPTVAFGQLPALPFPPRPSYGSLTYTLETPDGKLPVFPDQLEVISMTAPQSSLQSLEKAKTKAKGLGFSDEGKVIAENVPSIYVFPKQSSPSNLVFNIITDVFSISYDLTANPSVVANQPPAPDQAISRVRSLLQAGSSFPVDLTGAATTELLKIENGKFVKALSLSDAQMTKVNLFRKNIGTDPKTSIPMVTPEYPEANIWVILTGSNEVAQAEYHYFPLDETKKATYPIKTVQQAWEELQAGKAYIARKEDSAPVIAIRRVFLAYFDAGQYAEYLQPVIVFEGDNNFYAFVPAVETELYGKVPSPTNTN